MAADTPLRALVLGGKGFIGSHLVDALLAAGHDVRVFDRPGAPELHSARAGAEAEWLDGDFADPVAVAAAVDQRDVCFHLISTTLPKTSNDDPAFDLVSNVVSTVRFLEHAVAAGVKRVVFVSSGGTVYGVPQRLPIDETHPTDPICAYGIAKLAIEKYLHLFWCEHGLDYVVLRPSNAFGERQRTRAAQGAVAVFMGRVLREEPIEIWGDGSAIRDYVYVGDVVEALLAAATYRGEERVFNVASGTGMSLDQVLDGIEQVTGCTADRRYRPGRAFDVHANTLAIDRARAELRWAPRTPFLEGLERMARWLRHMPARDAVTPETGRGSGS